MFEKYRSRGAFCAFVLLLALFGLSMSACSTTGAGGATTPTPAQTPASTTGSPSNVPPATFKVTSVDLAVSPASLNGIPCGATITVTYTATFHFPANNPGGQAMFQYTTNNGRGSTTAGLIVPPDQTTMAYKFTWSGSLPADHTEPGPGGVMVTSPNTLQSALVAPTGVCALGASAAFKVVSIELSANPALTGHACGTMFTETYSAIFHIAPNGPGGTIVFNYTTNNGRGQSQNINLHVNAGQTSASYAFTWMGTLPADHTAPGVGIVLMLAPNQGESPAAVPNGSCS